MCAWERDFRVYGAGHGLAKRTALPGPLVSVSHQERAFSESCSKKCEVAPLARGSSCGTCSKWERQGAGALWKGVSSVSPTGAWEKNASLP